MAIPQRKSTNMGKDKRLRTVGDLLHWSYANLAMAHAAVTHKAGAYNRVHFMIRARLFSGLSSKTMTIGSLAEDERMKMTYPQACCYCGAKDKLSIDHLIPTALGGTGSADNLIWACRSCNSSKGAIDVMEWHSRRNIFPPLLLVRRYLKVAIAEAQHRGAMDALLHEPPRLPFSLDHIPTSFPPPDQLSLWITERL
jgi:hypothetical protein